MQRKRQSFKEIVFKREAILLVLLFLFIIGNWIFLIMAEELAPPDFYKLYEVAEKLYSGNLKIGIIPPLFSLIMYPLGIIFSLFIPSTEAFIFAGRSIALAASLGVIWFSYLLLKKIVGKWSILALVFLVISPWFLKLVSFPITDMLYLLFVTAAFYTFFNQSCPGLSIIAVVGGVLTRFEGVLLILSGIINYLKLKRRYVYILLVLLPVVMGLFFIFMPRIFHHLKDIILQQKSYLYIFQHPLEFFNIVYGNLLFFIPYQYPYFIKLTALILLFICFAYGIYWLFKRNRTFAFSLVIYEVLFLVAKGYIDTTDPEREFRRVFSGLWIFYILSFIGCYFLLKKIKAYRIPQIIGMVSGGLFLIIIIFFLPLIHLKLLFLAILIVLPYLYSLSVLALEKIPKYLAIFVLFIFTLQIYNLSFSRSEEYVVSYANKAAFAASMWINFSRLKENPVILSYTNNTMMHYYLIKEKANTKNIKWIEFLIPLEYKNDRERFKNAFFRQLKIEGVDYIIFDNYVVQKPEFTHINEIKQFLFEERENPAYFKLKNLFYKNQNVGYVLRPVID